LDSAQKGQGLLIARGFRDQSWALQTNHIFMQILAEESKKRSLRVFNRTACLVASIEDTPCVVHDNNINRFGISLCSFFGYTISGDKNNENANVLCINNKNLSMGDIHFVRILTGLINRCDANNATNQLNNLNGPSGIYLNCSSSWFSYARIIPCKINCFYCEDAYRPHVWGEVGCVPLSLYSLTEK
jgi:hypothetical protein